MKDTVETIMINAITEIAGIMKEMESNDERAVVDSDMVMCAYHYAVIALQLSLVHMAENPETLAKYAADGFESWTNGMIEKFNTMILDAEVNVPNPFKK